jgi:hypothetical protein
MTFPAFPRIGAAALTLAAPIALLGGCATALRPAAIAERAPGGGATASLAGVQIVTADADFPGMANIASAVTPVRVSITNNGSSTLLIRHSDFAFVAADGTSYPALPLHAIDTSVATSVPGIYDPLRSRLFLRNGARVSPRSDRVYPVPSRSGGGFPPDDGRYGWDGYDPEFGGAAAEIRLPTPAMYRNALPEGVLDPGRSIEGWVYFKRVAPRRGELMFRQKLGAVTGAELGTLSIPYRFGGGK